MSKTSKNTKATKTPTQYVYAYVFNGGVLKQNHCVVSVSTDHPETTVFNELKKYYGNDIKGAFYKCTKSLEEVQAGINFKMKKFSLGEILFNNNFSETKKILLDVTGLKQCTGTINVYKKDSEVDEEETEEKDEKEESKTKKASKSKKNNQEEGEADDSEPETKKKVKKSSSKSKKDKKVEVDSEPENNNKDTKTTKGVGKDKKTKESKSKKTELESDSSDDEVQPKKNNTSIELSDESDEEEED